MKSAPVCALALFFAAIVSVEAAGPPAGVDPARVQVLLRKLDADNFFTRQRADESLRAMGKAVLPLLRAERERTRSFEVRDRLDRMMRDLTFDEQVPTLVRLLSHANTKYRDQADCALRQAGAAIVPVLQKELKGDLDSQGRKRLEKIIAELSVQR
jgi:hypothetical protein